jgi:hypothetical protein
MKLEGSLFLLDDDELISSMLAGSQKTRANTGEPLCEGHSLLC